MSPNVKDKIKDGSVWVSSGAIISIVVFILLQFGLIGKSNANVESIQDLPKLITTIHDNSLSNEARFSKIETRQEFYEKQITDLIRIVDRNQQEIKLELKEIKTELKSVR
jgi:hypothetical protein